MSETKTEDMIDVTGTALWAKVFENNRDPGSKPGDELDYPEATTIELIVDQDNLKKIVKHNPKVKPKPTEDGMVVKFRRTWTNSINPAWGGVPRVVDADGNEWDTSKMIGNGSTVRVIAQPYKTKYGPAMRLMGVQVLEYVEPDLPAEPDLPF